MILFFICLIVIDCVQSYNEIYFSWKYLADGGCLLLRCFVLYLLSLLLLLLWFFFFFKSLLFLPDFVNLKRWVLPFVLQEEKTE